MKIEFYQPTWLRHVFSACGETQEPLIQNWPPIDLVMSFPYLWWVLPFLILLTASLAGCGALGAWFRQKPHWMIYLLLGTTLVFLMLFVAQQIYILTQSDFSFSGNTYSSVYFYLSGNFISSVLVCAVFIVLSLITVRLFQDRVAQGIVLVFTTLTIVGLTFGWLGLSYTLGYCPSL